MKRRSNEVQNISEWAWYYEGRHSLDVIVECRDAQGNIAGPTQTVKIPIRMLRNSLSHYPRPKRIGKRAGKVK